MNILKLFLSYKLSKWLGKPLVWARPMAVSIEPTTACNLGCPECPSGLKQFSRPTGNLSISLFSKIVEEIKSTTSYLTFYFQGEPFIHPKFLEMVKIAHDNGIYTSTSTNAHFIDEKTAERIISSGLDKLIISIDGTTQETYEKYRIHGSLEKALKGVENVIKAKKEKGVSHPMVVFQFLVVRHNEHQIEEVKKLGEEMGADKVVLKTAQVYDYENGNPLIPINDEYSRYSKGTDGKFSIKNSLLNQCWRMWSSCVITWDGKIVPCCFDKDASHSMGSVDGQSFEQIWHGKSYQTFRQSLLRSRSEIDICKNCSEGTKVWA